ncbi:MAG: T9SS type A sorting domain-containing protein [Bacteroidota bacterium]
MKTIVLSILLVFFVKLNAINPPALNKPVDGENYIDYDLGFEIYSVTGATKYFFEVDTVATFDSPFKLYDSTMSIGIGFNIMKYGFGKKYYWRAKSKSATEESVWSVTRSFTVQSKVEILSPANNYNSTTSSPFINVRTFGAGPSYYLELDTVPTFNSTFFRTLYPTHSASNVQAFHLPYGKKIYYRAWAFNGWSDTTEYSDTRIINIQAAPELLTPVNNSTGIDTAVLYTIDPIEGSIATMEVKIDEDPDFGVATTYSQINGKFKGLKFGTKYYWMARQITNSGTNISDWSAPFTFTTRYQLSKPVITSPMNNASNSADSITLSWLAATPSPVSTYYIEVDTNANFSNPNYYYTSNTTLKIKSLNGKAGNSVYIRIRANNVYGVGPWSSTLKINNQAVSVHAVNYANHVAISYQPGGIHVSSLTGQEFKLNLINMEGKMIQTHALSQSLTIDTALLNSGIYLLSIETADGVLINHKIIVVN